MTAEIRLHPTFLRDSAKSIAYLIGKGYTVLASGEVVESIKEQDCLEGADLYLAELDRIGRDADAINTRTDALWDQVVSLVRYDAYRLEEK